MQLLSLVLEILPSPSQLIRDTTGKDVEREGGREGKKEEGGREGKKEEGETLLKANFLLYHYKNITCKLFLDLLI